MLRKSVTVISNDPKNPRIKLTIGGKVEKFVTVSPKYARLYGPAGKTIKANIALIHIKKYPFKLLGPSTQKTKNVKYFWEEMKESDMTGYLLTIENLRNVKGRYFEMLTLKTDSNVYPEIKIRVQGNITDSSKTGKQ